MTEPTCCAHPLGDHVMIAHGSPMDGGVKICPEPGCVCVGTWDVPQAMAGWTDHARMSHRRALDALQGAYRDLMARRLLPFRCGCGRASWDVHSLAFGQCPGCLTDSEPGPSRPDTQKEG